MTSPKVLKWFCSLIFPYFYNFVSSPQRNVSAAALAVPAANISFTCVLYGVPCPELKLPIALPLSLLSDHLLKPWQHRAASERHVAFSRTSPGLAAVLPRQGEAEFQG